MELYLKQLSLWDRLTRKGDFYFHLIFTIVFSMIVIFTNKIDSIAYTIILISVVIAVLPFYTFFVHRYYIYSIYHDSDSLIIEYKKWFKSKKTRMNLEELKVESKVQYKINFETLVLYNKKVKIVQSIQGDWTSELMNKVYGRLLQLKK